jgi:hypothetical protein
MVQGKVELSLAAIKPEIQPAPTKGNVRAEALDEAVCGHN